MKKQILVLFTFIFTSHTYAGITDSLALGVGGGYNNYNTFQGEIYVKSDLKLFNRRSELKIGMNYRPYQLTFDSISGLEASSIGLFGDLVVYPFNKGLFAGVRWELITFNWFTEASKETIENERDYSATSLYTGTCIHFEVGYNFNISKNLKMKLYGQSGLQQFRISNGSSSSGNYVQTNTTENYIVEDYYEFIYSVNLSLEVSLN